MSIQAIVPLISPCTLRCATSSCKRNPSISRRSCNRFACLLAFHENKIRALGWFRLIQVFSRYCTVLSVCVFSREVPAKRATASSNTRDRDTILIARLRLPSIRDVLIRCKLLSISCAPKAKLVFGYLLKNKIPILKRGLRTRCRRLHEQCASIGAFPRSTSTSRPREIALLLRLFSAGRPSSHRLL